MPYVPERGEAVWLQFNPQAGQEQSGHRPAIVLSPLAYNQRVGLALFCPITTQVKRYPFEVTIPAGLAVSGVILADQVKILDWQARSASLSCRLPDEIVEEVLQKLLTLIR